MQTLKFMKMSPDAPIPTRQTSGAAGFDLHASHDSYVPSLSRPMVVSTGIAVQIPAGYVGLIRDRSGLARKHGLLVMGGVIDSDYTGEIMVMLSQLDNTGFYEIKKGDRIAQLLIVPCPAFDVVVVDSLDDTERGDGGFGSTGIAA